ncbi:MAG: P-II family nitrogen regulator [Alphaproteobacteria bacterium]|nr:P-II family nitrogen regulator [Alphaproteobacteria bacterium]
MKMVMAVIKPFKLEDVRDALAKIGVSGLTASDVTGFGRQKGQEQGEPDNRDDVTFVQKTKLEIVVSDDLCDLVIDTIQKVAHTGRIGDGKIFVYNIERAVRIRTGEEDKNAV